MRELELNDRVTLRVVDGDAARGAVLLPGFLGGPWTPPMRYAWLVLEARGFEVVVVDWRPVRDDRWVLEQAAAALEHVRADRPLVVAKSLGTRALPLAVDRGLPGVWLTPLLQLPEVVSALERATAPTLIVGGSADEAWDEATAARLPVERHVVEGGDHALEVGDPFASLDALRSVAARIDEFAGRL